MKKRSTAAKTRSTVKKQSAVADDAKKLQYAIDQLIEEQHQRHNGNWIPIPSIYLQLREATGGAQGGGARSGFRFRSLPLVWVDVLDLLDEIDAGCHNWGKQLDLTCRGAQGVLYAIHRHSWTPDTVKTAQRITNDVNDWLKRAEKLLDPTPTKTLSAPCPNCTQTHYYHQDSGGDDVRSPALQLTSDGCTCQACKTFWPPAHFELLASVLAQFPIVRSSPCFSGYGALACIITVRQAA